MKRCDQCGHEFISEDATAPCPQCGSPMVFESEMHPKQGRIDCAWETRDSLMDIGALFDTARGVLLEPTLTFRSMKTEGDMGSPSFYAVIVGSIAIIAGAVWNILFQSIGFMQNQDMAGQAAIQLGVTVGMIVLSPLLAIAGAYIGAGIIHVGLMIAGGANKGFEATFRVVSYAMVTSLLQIVPCCGGFVGAVWNIVVVSIGLKEMHETTIGRALIAIFLPLLICCGGLGLLASLVGGAVILPMIEQFTH